MSGYQTILYGDGKTEEGVFDTKRYFDAIKTHVPFGGKSVLELGCNTGMYLLYAKQSGADYIFGIDKDASFIQTANDIFDSHKLEGNFICGEIEKFYPIQRFDIVMCPMILHWVSDGESQTRRFLKLTEDYFVVVYREKNEGYSGMNGNWFPTQEEMDYLVKSQHFDKIHSEVIQSQEDKNIVLSIYKRYKHTSVEGGVITKLSTKYDQQWEKNINMVAKRLKNTPFIQTVKKDGVYGYQMRYINGFDLCGDRPFNYIYNERLNSLSDESKEIVLESIKDIFTVGMEVGVIPGDITLRNFIFYENKAYFVDFNPFIPVENNRIDNLDFIYIIRDCLERLGVPGFNGDLTIL